MYRCHDPFSLRQLIAEIITIITVLKCKCLCTFLKSIFQSYPTSLSRLQGPRPLCLVICYISPAVSKVVMSVVGEAQVCSTRCSANT